MSRGIISYRRLVVSCSKMALDGSICDETMAKMWRKPVEMQGLFACMLFFFGVFSATLISGVCFSLRLLSYRDGDPSMPHLNLRGKHFLTAGCKHNSARFEKWLEILSVKDLTPKGRRPELQPEQGKRRRVRSSSGLFKSPRVNKHGNNAKRLGNTSLSYFYSNVSLNS